MEWKAIKTWNLPDIGAEGFAWASMDGVDYFYVCIDTAKNTGNFSFRIHTHSSYFFRSPKGQGHSKIQFRGY